MKKSKSFRVRLAAGAALTALSMAVAGPAAAHDTLVGSDPESGAQLEEAPDTVTLTFSGELIDVSPQSNLLDESGEIINSGAISLEGYDAVIELPADLPSGDYRVAYSVVSSDGHRIEGDVPFTVTGGGSSSAATDVAETTEAAATTDATTTDAETSDAETTMVTATPVEETTPETTAEVEDAVDDAEPDNTMVDVIRYTGIFIVFFGLTFIVARWWKSRR